MNTDNLSALAVGVAVVALIAGFGIYFNSPDLNRVSLAAAKQQQQQQPDQFVPAVAVVTDSGNGTKIEEKIDKSQFQQAPELAGISNYINTADGGKAITLAGLKDKVVLVDFWTYSCINCIRTIRT